MQRSFATKFPSGRGIAGILIFLFPKPGYMPGTAGYSKIQSSVKSPAQIPTGKYKLSRSVCAAGTVLKSKHCSLAQLSIRYPRPQGGVVANEWCITLIQILPFQWYSKNRSVSLVTGFYWWSAPKLEHDLKTLSNS